MIVCTVKLCLLRESHWSKRRIIVSITVWKAFRDYIVLVFCIVWWLYWWPLCVALENVQCEKNWMDMQSVRFCKFSPMWLVTMLCVWAYVCMWKVGVHNMKVCWLSRGFVLIWLMKRIEGCFISNRRLRGGHGGVRFRRNVYGANKSSCSWWRWIE